MARARPLSRRALNRALLERQLLLRRATMPVADALEHVVGLQAQTPQSPYVSLAARLEGFRPDELSSLIESRRAVRLALMRGTLHLVTAADCRALRPVMQPILDRLLQSGSPFGKRLAGMDLAPLLAAGRAWLEEKPRTLAELRVLVHERWPDRDPDAMAYAIHYSLPLVQLPPRGLWQQSGRPICTTAEHWLGRPLVRRTSPAPMILRYLAAFGPATVQDIQAWSGLQKVRELVDRLKPKLRVLGDEAGRELFDVPDGALPDEDTPAPPRLLPDYDNVFLSHADRSRIVSDGVRVAERPVPVFLVDGFLRGTWSLVRGRLKLDPVGKLTKQERQALEEEAGDRLPSAIT